MKKTPTTFFRKLYARDRQLENSPCFEIVYVCICVSVCIFKENGFSETVKNTEDFGEFEAKYNIEL